MNNIKKIFAVAAAFFMAASIYSQSKYYVVDGADVLSQNEEYELQTKLNRISNEQMCDVVVVTIPGLNGKSAEAFADDYFDYNDYGFGELKSGILLLVSMAEREFHMTTHEFGVYAFTDDRLQNIQRRFIPYMSNGNWFLAFNSFADDCEEILTAANNDSAYTQIDDSGHSSNSNWDFGVNSEFATFAGIVGFFSSLVGFLIKKKQLKSVRKQAAANNYFVKNSLNLTNKDDIFLYTQVSRTPRANVNSGSTTHTSSSGRSHGGSGGHF